jgi:peptide/nickel transport system substrate-binding protein
VNLPLNLSTSHKNEKAAVKKRLGTLMGATALALSMTLTACGGGSTGGTGGASGAGPTASDADPNSTLRVGFTIPTPALNPHKMASSPAAFPYLTPVYDRLTQMVDKDGELELAPMVATEWTFAEDGRSATFTLRDGVTFSDGAPLDATAVKATLDHAKFTPGSTVASYFVMIDSVVVVDPTHIKISTNRPAADLPYVLAGVEASLISPLALDNPDLDVHPVGSGPYTATEVRIGDSATYERREGYWDPSAQLSKTIVIKGYPDDNARLNALRSGQVDVVNTKVGQYAQASKLGGSFDFYSYPPSQVYSMYMNVDRPNLDNKLVRQALNFAVDRDGINKSLLNGQCTPSTQPLTEPMDGYLQSPPVQYTHDPERSKELLSEAGATNITINALVGAGLSPQEDIASALKAQFQEVGVTLNVQPSDAVESATRYASKAEDAHIQVRISDPTSMQSLARNFTNPRLFPGTTPPAFITALAPAYNPSATDEERTKALQAASSVVDEDALDVFVCAVPTQFAYTNKVIGVDSQGVAHYSGLFDVRYLGMAR